MATEAYESKNINLIDGTELTLMPLKIKYLRQFMEAFELVKTANDDEEAIIFLSNCAAIAMKQYYPKISTISELEDNVDLPTIYKILDIAAGIKIDEKSENPVKEQAEDGGSSWEKLDLAKLEAEVFLLGIWKDYEQLELSLSMPELMLTLESKREFDYQEKKFFAAIQGVDLDKNNNKESGNKWEEMKAKVFSGGKAANSNDVLALQGVNAQKAGFGIGMGLGYEDLTKTVKK
jgi:hypothetical protein